MKPYTDEQIKIMWAEHIKKRKHWSKHSKDVFSWMFNFEEFKEVMKLAHLPNPYLSMTKK